MVHAVTRSGREPEDCYGNRASLRHGICVGFNTCRQGDPASLMSTDVNAEKPFYRPEDISGLDYAADLSDPGTYPYPRGRLTRPRREPTSWILRELSGEGSPAQSNRQFRDLIARGALGLDVIGDAPTVTCLDPDHPFARASVGT